MNSTLAVKLKFLGPLAVRAGLRESLLDLGGETSGADRLEKVKREVEEQIGSDVLFSILVNGRNISLVLKEGIEIGDGDEITVVPVILGG